MIGHRVTRVLFLVMLVMGCAGPASQQVPPSAPMAPACCEPDGGARWRDSVVQTAAGLVGASEIEVDGRRIAYDCAGVTRAIFLPVGVDLYHSDQTTGQANGVTLIYRHVRQFGRLHQGPLVRPGDLVFFHNTWDANGDGRINDPLTHVGVVEAVESNGTVVFISRVAGAVERYRMNLMHPHRHQDEAGRVFNDFLRRKNRRDVEGTPYLTAELFTTFGTPILR